MEKRHCVEKYRGGFSHVFEEGCGSTVEAEQLLTNIDFGANRIIINRVHLFDEL